MNNIKPYLASLLFLITITGNNLQAQTVEGISIPGFIAKLQNAKTDSERVLLYLAEGELYRLRVGSFQRDIDSAMLFAGKAKELSKKINYHEGYRKGIILEISSLIEQENMEEIRRRIRSMKRDEVLADIYIVLCKYYLDRPGTTTKDMDSAYFLINEALVISREIHSTYWESMSLRVFGRYFFDKNEIETGRKYFLKSIESVRHLGMQEVEADLWIDYGYRLPDHDNLFDEKVNCVTKSIELFHEIGNSNKELWAMKARAEIYRRQGRLEIAEKESLNVLQLQQKTKASDIHTTYNILSEIEMFRGDYSKALKYSLSAIDAMSASHDTIYAGVVYEKMGNIYSEMNDPAKSMEWYEKALQFFSNGNDEEEIAMITALMAQQLVNTGNAAEALALLQKSGEKFTPRELIMKELYASIMGAAYSALGEIEVAEKYYTEMIVVERIARSGNQSSANAYYSIGKFYLDINHYAQAKKYLDTALIMAPGRVPASRVKDIHFMLFKTDSSLGNYNLAIHHLQAYHILKDSIYNDKKIRQIAQIQAQYEINKKQKDIELLKKQGLIQEQQIKQSLTVRRFTYAGIAMLLILLGLGYNRYRLKQKSAQQLMVQQKEISAKNSSLQQLVKEKEWLVREVHHRVKNNLQIIMSLLSEQKEYLNNDVALGAFNEVSNRMQAISLIHQKLYLPNSPETIEMKTYIREFISYLKESLEGAHKFFFDIHVDPVKLNISQAVPIGLIMNEAVTNSIKHAFKEQSNGAVKIYLQRTGIPDQLMLLIADNGTGLPPDVEFEKSDSLGLKLIRTFSDQLDAELKISAVNGVQLEIIFFQSSGESVPI